MVAVERLWKNARMTSTYDSGDEYESVNLRANQPAGLQTAYTVSAVADYLKVRLESDPRLADLAVVGEVSGYRNPSSGHHYFALRDE